MIIMGVCWTLRRQLLYISAFGLLLFTTASKAEDGKPAEGPPTITEHPLDVIVAKGEPATLNCAAKDASEYLWYKDGEPVITAREEPTSHRLVLNNGALFLLRVHSGKSGKEADSGTYYCVAINKYGETRSREAQLKIAMLRDDFRTRPGNVQAVMGGRAVLECAPPKGFPEPVVSWKKDERELRPEDDTRITLHPSGNLVIESVRRTDSGFYQCIATNMVGEKASNPARLSVYEKPHFQQRPDDVTAEVADSVLFACRVAGDPMPVIVWRKKDGKMPFGRAQILEGKGLRIVRVNPADEGEYVCQAKNPAGSIETSARLTVHAPPAFEKEPVDQTVEEGASGSFDCQANGNPLPARFWSKEGHQELMFPGHVSIDGRVKVSTEGQLTISGVSSADQGYYVCSALNAAGSNIAKAYLKVSGRTLSAHPPPVVVLGPANQTLTLKSSAILPCQATGQSPPTITWLRDNRPLDLNEQDAGRFSLLTTGSLQISDLRKTDTGVYTCKAKNADGETTWSGSLLVEEHTNPDVVFSRMPDATAFPSEPGAPTILNASETTVTLKWALPEKQGASPITGYILQYFSPDVAQTWYNVPDYVRDGHFVVKELKPAQSYVFVVRAENSHGIGKPSTLSQIARTMGSAGSGSNEASSNLNLDLARKRLGGEQLIKLLEVKTVNSTAMKLFWRQLRPEPLIGGYYIKWRGPPSPRRSWVNVTNPGVTSYTVSGLLPYTTYGFFVTPYHGTVEGIPSNSMDGTTEEAPPSVAPQDVHVRMMNLTTLRISWRPPPPNGINGLLRGYQIVVLGNSTKFNRNISTNERAASVTLFHLVPSMVYTVKVAAKTGAGIGVYHGEDKVTMDRDTLERHLEMAKGENSHEALMKVVKTPWFIACVGLLLWIVLMALAGAIYWRKKKAKGKEAARLGMPFIKINDGSVHMTARDALWMDHVGYNTAQRSMMLNGSTVLNNGHVHHPPPGTIAAYHHNGQEYYVLGNGSAPPDYPGSPAPTHELISRTLNRPASPNHYHYAALSTIGCPVSNNQMSTFYPMNGLSHLHHHQDDPSPYATTTLVMANGQKMEQHPMQHRWLQDHMLRGPSVPPAPPPSGPPPGFQQNNHQLQMMTGSGLLIAAKPAPSTSTNQSESPPNTDTSYVHSDGTAGSGSGNGVTGGYGGGGSRSGTTGSRRTPKQTLMDFIPPPPPGCPPPGGVGTPNNNSAPVRRREMTNYGPELDIGQQHNQQQQQQQRYGSASPLDRLGDTRIHNGPSGSGSRRYSPAYKETVEKCQRSSLIENDDDDGDGDDASCSSMDSDNIADPVVNQAAINNDLNGSVDYGARRAQPCMGVNASALTQSSYDAALANGVVVAQQRSNSRLKSLPRNSRKDFV